MDEQAAIEAQLRTAWGNKAVDFSNHLAHIRQHGEPIFVTVRAAQLHDQGGLTLIDTLTDEIREWLGNKIGPREEKWHYLHCAEYAYFSFYALNDAIMFKLRWS